MNLALLKYPKKSHRKIIRIPSESIELAELMGIIAGDGGINNDWQLVISLNSIKDLEYSKYIYQLLKNLFNTEVAIRKRPKQNALVLVCSSTNLLDFLVAKGAVRGNKITQRIDIPVWIKDNPDYEKAFVRGLVDTDGCLFIHKHTVKGELRNDIGFCFTNYSRKLLNSVADILTKFKIKQHVTDKGKRIYLYGAKTIVDYLEIFGSSNPIITNTYKKWRGARAAESACLERM
jgi:intein/homing endonuclease